MPDLFLVLIAPNVSEQMGGEGIKALQIFQEMRKLQPDTVQITHGRNRAEIARLGLSNVEFVDDTAFAIFLWRSVVLRWLLDVWFSAMAVRLAEAVAASRGNGRRVIVHHTEPNSPVTPRTLSSRHINVFGPINGNIYYPQIFRAREERSSEIRRRFHLPLQAINRVLLHGIRLADQILVAGGERTSVSLRTAGCHDEVLRPTIDCGVEGTLLDRPRIAHAGSNPRFVHFGRLVYYKGTALAIEALARTRPEITLDIIGTGPEHDRCQALAQQLGVADRVRFLGWRSHDELLASLTEYRGVVLPSFGDSNGIVVQEAMALGVPVVCLDWGGPGLLIEHGVSGFLVKPESIGHITSSIARHLEDLAGNPTLAESMSRKAREAANAWRWSHVARQWLEGYPRVRRSKQHAS